MKFGSEKVNILVFSQYYYPERIGPTEICEKLVEEGNTVKVITGLPNYPDGNIKKDYKFLKNRNQNINGVDIERTFEIGRKKSKVFLALNYLSFCISATFKSLFLSNKFDIVYCYQLSPVTVAIPAIIYSKLKNKKLVLYCLDIWPESLKVMNINEKSIIYKIFNYISKKVYNNCDKIMISSKTFKEYLVNKHNVDENIIEYSPQFSKDFRKSNVEECVNNDKVKFLFAGNIGKAQNVEIIVEAVKLLKDKDNIIINIVGDGSNLEKIKLLVEKNQLEDKIIFHGQVEKEQMDVFYSNTDVCLLTLKSDSFIGKTLPLKLQSYMSSGKPIIASIDGAAVEVIIDVKCGICVKPSDPQSLSEAIYEFANNMTKYQYMGENGRIYYEENYTLRSFINNLNIILKEVIGDVKNV